jgi:signal transduction histidine kinase
MNVGKSRKRAFLSWLLAVVLVCLCATLGVMQYRWIGEVSRAEHERLLGNLHVDLQRISDDFDSEIRSASAAFSTDISTADEEADRERDLAIRYARWRASSRYSGLIRSLAIAVRGEDSLSLRILDLEKGTFGPADWPAKWSGLRDRLSARAYGDPAMRIESFHSNTADDASLIELPQFIHPERGLRFGAFSVDGPGRPPSPGLMGMRPHGEFGWTILELDLDYVRDYALPELLQRYLGSGGKLDYHVEIVPKDHPSTVIYDSDPNQHSRATFHSDASIELFQAPFAFRIREQGPGNGPGLWQVPGPVTTMPPPGLMAGVRVAGGEVRVSSNPGHGRWLLSVRHRTGSLETLVEQNRRRSLAVTAAVLLLMLAAAGALVQFTRRAQRLAELQMEFVAGVSHELRTPLSVIRTAAHNLGVRVISNANQVQRYGSLIEEQSEKLTDIVDRVLLFSNAKAGRVISSREAVDVDFLVEESLGACAKIVEQSFCEVETRIEPGLPPIFGDPTALKHALMNLIGNAAKYAAEGRWMGVSAMASNGGKSHMVEIRVADRGPGIPRDELAHIFDPFYRGKMAVDDQIHGTGLGLSLVERIVKAHGGTVEVKSEPGKGTEFVMRIPAAPAEQIDEFADSANRR